MSLSPSGIPRSPNFDPQRVGFVADCEFSGLPCPLCLLVRAEREDGTLCFSPALDEAAQAAVPADTNAATVFDRPKALHRNTPVRHPDCEFGSARGQPGRRFTHGFGSRFGSSTMIWLCCAGRFEARRNDVSAAVNRLGITAGSVTGENRHCLLDVVHTSEFMREWIGRISTIPKWFLEDACSHVRGIGLGKTLREVVRLPRASQDADRRSHRPEHERVLTGH